MVDENKEFIQQHEETLITILDRLKALENKLERERKVKIWDTKVINRMNKQIAELKEAGSARQTVLRRYINMNEKDSPWKTILLEKLDSDPVQKRIDRLDAGGKILKKHEEALNSKASGGEKSETGIKGSRDKSCGSMASFPNSKPPEPKCPFCGRKLILYKQEWICGHGCTKPAIKADEKLPEPCKHEFEAIDDWYICKYCKKPIEREEASEGEKEVVSTALRGDQKAVSGGSVLPSNSRLPEVKKEPEKDDEIVMIPMTQIALEVFAKEIEKELIEEFLKRFDWILDRVVFHTENPDSELMDELTEEYITWQGRLNK